MDRALKERIVGAIVLVLFAVLVVPVFLDGPSQEPATVQERISLPGQSSESAQNKTIVLNRDRNEPVPVAQPVPQAASPSADTSALATAGESLENSPVVSNTKPAEQAAVDLPSVDESAGPTPGEAESRASAAQPDVASSSGMWAVQLGSFSNEDNARRLAAKLRADGYAAFLSRHTAGGSALHRVRIGPQKDRQSAEAVAASLVKSGHTGRVVPHP